MSAIAIVFLTLSVVLVWGGLILSTVFLVRRPEPAHFPAGGDDDDREFLAPVEHDT